MVATGEGLGPAVGSAAWWRDRQRRRERQRTRRRAGLTIDRIASAALAFTDEHGAEALTVRRLADELGTGHASLYRHIESREALLVEMFDTMLDEIERPPAGVAWPKHLEHVAHELRRVLLAHPSLLPLAEGARLFGPNAMDLAEAALSAALEQGVRADVAARGFFSIMSYVVGVTMVDFQAGSDAQDSGDLRDAIVDASRGQHPALEHVMRDTVRREGESELSFQFGLRALLDRVERLLV